MSHLNEFQNYLLRKTGNFENFQKIYSGSTIWITMRLFKS